MGVNVYLERNMFSLAPLDMAPIASQEGDQATRAMVASKPSLGVSHVEVLEESRGCEPL